jgi:hypothetical protein
MFVFSSLRVLAPMGRHQVLYKNIKVYQGGNWVVLDTSPLSWNLKLSKILLCFTNSTKIYHLVSFNVLLVLLFRVSEILFPSVFSFEARLQNWKKRLLDSSCPSVRRSVCESAWNTSNFTGEILIKFHI